MLITGAGGSFGAVNPGAKPSPVRDIRVEAVPAVDVHRRADAGVPGKLVLKF